MEGTNEAAEPAVVGRACLPMERTDEPTVYTSSSPGIEELVWKARRLASERRRDMERRFEDVVEDQLDNVFPDFIPKRDTEHDAQRQRSREGQVAGGQRATATFDRPRCDLRVALGMAAGAAMLLGQHAVGRNANGCLVNLKREIQLYSSVHGRYNL